MATLLIIDIQNTYIDFIKKTSIIEDLPEFSKNYNNIYYLFDSVSGQEYYSELPIEWIDNEENDDVIFSDRFNKVIEKQYGFFRDIMDSGVLNDEELVDLIKFMIKYNITDGRDIKENEEILDLYWNSYRFNRGT